MSVDERVSGVASYPLLDALRERRSRRVGLGMRMAEGPLVHAGASAPVPLCEEEEAHLAFAACGLTGHALGDLVYTPAGGGTILAGLAGRTVASGDAIHTVSVFVINDEATYLLKRPRDLAAEQHRELVDLAGRGELLEAYRRSRVLVRAGRTAPPLHSLYNLSVNQWSLYAEGGTYFLPVNELTHLYINGLLEILGEHTGAFLVDERAGFRPAGVGRFARSKGGHLRDAPRDQMTLTIQQVEGLVSEFVTIEQGMVLQNLGLMTQALGLGGFPHWAAHPYGWLESLGFSMQQMPASRYLGMGPVLRTLAGWLGRDVPVSHALGLELDGEPVLVPYCPPWYPSMEAAVRAVVDYKFAPTGIFRGGTRHGAFRDPDAIAGAAEAPSEATIAAAVAYCDYVFRRYGRFPAYPPPFRTVLGFQASHVDTEFYDRFYEPEALSERQRRHMHEWHAPGAPSTKAGQGGD